MENGADIPELGQYFTVSAIAGSYFLECFIAARAFLDTADEHQLSFTEEHYHSSYELLLCRDDEGFAFINGVGHSYEKNTAFLVPPYTKHASISSRGRLCGWYSIRFELQEPPRVQTARDPALDAAFARLRQDGCFQFTADADLLELLDLTARTMQTSAPYAELLLSGLLSAVFSWVFRAMCLASGTTDSASRTSVVSDDATRRKFLVDYYFDHLMYSTEDTEKKMEDLCRQLHLSSSQLNRVLKETYGTSFKKRKIEVRLAYIKYYLKCSDYSVSEIARRTNFVSDSSFSLFFKQHCGMSPTEYRRTERSAPVMPERPEG